MERLVAKQPNIFIRSLDRSWKQNWQDGEYWIIYWTVTCRCNTQTQSWYWFILFNFFQFKHISFKTSHLIPFNPSLYSPPLHWDVYISYSRSHTSSTRTHTHANSYYCHHQLLQAGAMCRPACFTTTLTMLWGLKWLLEIFFVAVSHSLQCVCVCVCVCVCLGGWRELTPALVRDTCDTERVFQQANYMTLICLIETV